MSIFSKNLPDVKTRRICPNSIIHKIKNYYINYEGELPIDGLLMFEQLGLEWNRKNYTSVYNAVWFLKRKERVEKNREC